MGPESLTSETMRSWAPKPAGHGLGMLLQVREVGDPISQAVAVPWTSHLCHAAMPRGCIHLTLPGERVHLSGAVEICIYVLYAL